MSRFLGDETFEHFMSASTPTNSDGSSIQQHQAPKDKKKKKRNPPGNPDPDAEVIALSPKSLMTTNRFVCEICQKGFQRDQNLQLHRRGHNLPWKLRQRTSTDTRKRVYVCPETCCIHHNPSRALGDLTGIKKHYSRKHGEKKWKCDKCTRKYAVQSDWKAHSRTCGTREYKCDCGTTFNRRDSFITHRAFCDALAEETIKNSKGFSANYDGSSTNPQGQQEVILPMPTIRTTLENELKTSITAPDDHDLISHINDQLMQMPLEPLTNIAEFPTPFLQNAADHQIGANLSSNIVSPPTGQKCFIQEMETVLSNANLFHEECRMQDLGTYNSLFNQNLDFLNNSVEGCSSAGEDGTTINIGRNQGGIIDAEIRGHISDGSLRKCESVCGSISDSNFLTLDLMGIGGGFGDSFSWNAAARNGG